MKKSLFNLAAVVCLSASALLAGNGTKIHNPDGSVNTVVRSNNNSRFMAVSPGAALNFDGSNDYINLGSAISVTTGYTKEAWIYPNASGSCNILSSNTSPFWLAGNKISAAHHWGIGGTVQISDPTNIVLNTWTHVAVTYNASNNTLILYKNGVQVAISTVAPSYSVEPIQMGAYNASNWFQGAIDEVRLWNYPRTQCEIASAMNCELSTSRSGLAAYYKLNEGIASGANTAITTAVDSSGNGFNATLLNFGLSSTATSNWIAPGGVTTGVSCNFVNGLVAINSPTICIGATTTLTATGLSNYTWNTSATTASISASPTVTTNYTVSGTDSYSCAATGTATITVEPFPTISISTPTITAGATTTLTASGPPTYTWNTSATTSTISVAPTTTSAYTVTGTGGCVTTTTVDVFGAALNFNGGGSNYIAVTEVGTTLDNLGLANFTMEAWINPSNISGVTSIIRKSGDYNLYLNNGVIYAELWPNGMGNTTFKKIAGTTTLSLNTWYHVAFTWNTTLGTGALYLNGIAEATVVSNTTISASESLRIGQSASFGQPFYGSIDELRIWNRALCQGEIQNSINGEFSIAQTGLELYYKFNQGVSSISNATVTTAIDASGIGNNGTLTNFALNGTISNWVAPGAVTTGSNSPAFVSPTVSIAGANSICAGSTTTFTASGVSTYTWTSGPTTATYAVSPTVTTTYSVVGTNSVGCNSGITVKTLTVNTLPVISVNSGTICAGSSFTMSPTGANTYTYTGGSAVVTPTANATYTVTGASAAGCVGASGAVTAVTVNALPSYSLTATSYSICNGSSKTFTVSGANTYTWTPATTLAGANTANPTASPTTTTIYSVTGTSAAGCANTTAATVTLTVNALPVISVSGGAICIGQSFTLSPTGASTYTYTGGSAVITPTTNTTYTVTGTSAAGCVSAVGAVATVTVNTLPIVTVNSATICAGATTTLTANGAISYAWNTGPTTASITPSPATTTHYTVTGTDIHTCTNTATAIVTVNNLPIVTVNSPTICVGATTNLTAVGATLYAWNTGATSASISASPTTTTNYTVTGTDGNNCSNTATSIVTVNALPTVTVNSPTICVGATATLTANGATSYVWNTSATGAIITDSPTSNTSYTVTGTDGNNCSNTATSNVTVNNLPTVMVNSATICVGDITTLTANGAVSYAWNTGAATATITASPVGNASYTVTGTDGNNCSNTATSNVTVNNLPTVTVNSATICVGNVATLTANGATTYVWSPATGLSASSGATVSSNPAVITHYTVTGTDGNNCSNTAISIVTVNSLPVISANTATICVGATATLTASGVTSYTWNTGSNSASISDAPTVTTTYTVNGTDGNNCSNWDTTSITVNALPSLTVTPQTICPAATATLQANPSTLTSYTWSSGLSGTSGSAVTGNPSSSTNYTVSATDANGCVGTTTTSISVVTSLTVTATTADTAVCGIGGTTTLSGLGASSYTWTASAGSISSSTGTNITVTPSGLTTYTVMGSSGACTASPYTLTVNVHALPTVTVNSATICAGDVATLTAGGANTYSWSTGAATATYTDSPTGNTSYTVTGTDLNNCLNTAIATVLVNSLPVIVVNSPTICVGDAATLTASGATSFTWSTNEMTSSISPTATVTTNYTVTAIDGNNCTNTDTTSIYVNALPTLTVTPQTICPAATATLVANSTTLVTYTWSAGLSSTSGSSVTGSPSMFTTYTVSATDLNGCIGTTTTSIDVVTSLTVTAVATNTAVCGTGGSTTLTGLGASSYTWTSSAGTMSGTTGSNITVMPSGLTTYTVDGSSGTCAASQYTLTVGVNPLPSVTISASTTTLCAGATATLTAGGATTYNWSTSATTASIVTSPTVTTHYTVTGTDANNCSNTDTTSITVNCTIGIDKVASNNMEIAIYPNPNNGMFVVTTTENAKTILVSDMLGNEVITIHPNDTTTNLNMSAQPSGIYFVKVITGSAQTVKRIIINN